MKDTYLWEREYRKDQRKPVNEKKKQYWDQLLGEALVAEFQKYDLNFKAYLEDQRFERKKGTYTGSLRVEYREWSKSPDEIRRKIGETKLFFAEFYESFLITGIDEFKRQLNTGKEQIAPGVYEDFRDELAVRLQNIALRTLIAEMHGYKQRGMLKGADSKEQYQDFCKQCGSEEFFYHIADTYPVLIRCIRERIECQIQYYVQVMQWFREDSDKIGGLFFDGGTQGRITGIESGLSDLHNGGTEVLKICLENGKKLLLKPRSMENEQFFTRLLGWISERTGSSQYHYTILSRYDHSWCEIVEYQSCESEQDIHQYYRRLGEQLFLAYLLGTSDIHAENLIACGPYPVIVDLEALARPGKEIQAESAEDAIYSWIRELVIGTGILPFYVWNKEGEGIDGSAIHSKKGQKLPFQIPAVAEEETSNMYITYREGFTSAGRNLAWMKGKEETIAAYVDDLLSGFSEAYQAVEKEKVFFQRALVEGKGLQSRVVLMHTQRYAMLLNSSYHPSLLMDGAEREIFLYSIGQGRWDREERIVREEILALLRGDIPCFSSGMDEKSLYAGEEKCEEAFFQRTAYSRILERLGQLDQTDRNKQCDLIRTSMELIPENKEHFMNQIYEVRADNGFGQTMDKESLNRIIAALTDRLCIYAIWNQKKSEVSWPVLHFASSGNYAWQIRPMGVYFYDGLSGMLLLTTVMQEKQKSERIGRIQKALQRQLFQYTDEGMEELKNLQSQNTGAYTGESSIVYTYLKLYQLTKEAIYLQYSRKHAEIVSKIVPKDTCADLLGGKAGAAWIFLQMFEQTGEERYVKEAEKAVYSMIPQAVKMDCGIGWKLETGENPVSGMAHGNAGILMPVLELWELTKKQEYEILAQKIREYEESLYDEKRGNWIDRGQDQEEGEDTVAWCHGAAGILLTRLWCYQRVTDRTWKERLKTDMERAYRKTETYWKRDSWSLCHGTGGNLWILDIADRVLGKEQKNRMDMAGFRLLPQEKLNPGIMSGYGGILLYLLGK
ncbi:MAG: type 2 lanthipeptide synthetase LanM [Sellimonas sp.]|nr:type 2 lanthipeptide synthetase LanM [Sellimonas sp.]